MFSMLNRIRAGAFVRVVVLALAMSGLFGALAPGVLAREPKDPGPFIHPGGGDTDDVNGFKGYDFEEPPGEGHDFGAGLAANTQSDPGIIYFAQLRMLLNWIFRLK